MKCTKPGYTFELFRVANLKSTTATPFKTEYTSLISSVSAEILAGDSKAALDALDTADLSTAVSQGTFTSSATNTTQSFSNLERVFITSSALSTLPVLQVSQTLFLLSRITITVSGYIATLKSTLQAR